MADTNQNTSADSSDERYVKAVPVVRSFLESVLGLLGVEVEVDIDIEEDGLHCDLNTTEEDGGLLIGRHGATLDSLQYLTLRVLQAEGFERMRITLDVGGYRTRRERTLRELAHGVGAKVLDSGRPYHFDPMSAMERRVLHMALMEVNGLHTESEGEGRYRHVVVFPDHITSKGKSGGRSPAKGKGSKGPGKGGKGPNKKGPAKSSPKNARA